MTACYIGWSQEDGNTKGRCCCNCRYHLEDFHHCTTVEHRTECVCSQHKGWICIGMVGDGGGAHSGWTEHGACELHEFKKVTQ